MEEQNGVPTIGARRWEDAIYGTRYTSAGAIHNLPINKETVSHVLAQKINRAIYNHFDGLETTIQYAGVDGGDYGYWVVSKDFLPRQKMDELRAFVRGFIVCYRALV